MDSAFKARPFPACTLAHLRQVVATAASPDPRMVAEIERREAVEAGDMSRATDGERLRVARGQRP